MTPGSQTLTYEFDQCEKFFSGSHGLKTHRKIHTEYMKYKCPLCNKCFTKAKELKIHNISKLCLLKTDNITYSVAVQQYVQLFGNCNHTEKFYPVKEDFLDNMSSAIKNEYLLGLSLVLVDQLFNYW